MSRLIRRSNITENKGPGYENTYGQVTPYHILFKDFGNDIAALPKDQAVEYVVKQLRALNDKHGSDPEYAKLNEEQIKSLKEELLGSQYNNGMDILFAIKDKLLESEGAEAKPEEEAPKEEEQPAEQPTEQPAPVEEAPQEPVQPESAPEAPPTTEEPPKQASIQKRLIKKNVR